MSGYNSNKTIAFFFNAISSFYGFFNWLVKSIWIFPNLFGSSDKVYPFYFTMIWEKGVQIFSTRLII